MSTENIAVPNGKVYQGDFTNYTTLSLWDTYRAAHPLMTLIHKEMLPRRGKYFYQYLSPAG